MSSKAKFRCLFLVFFFMIIASSLGCGTLPGGTLPVSGPDYRKILDSEIPNYKTEISDFKSSGYSSNWAQPINKSEKCEILFEAWSPATSGNVVEWDGECKNGKAEGLGKISTTLGSITVHEVTYHNKGITNEFFYTWAEGTNKVEFGLYVHENNQMVKRIKIDATTKPDGSIDGVIFQGEHNLITGVYNGVGTNKFSNGHMKFTGQNGNRLFFGTAEAFEQNKPLYSKFGYYDISVLKPGKFSILRSKKHRDTHQLYQFGNFKENVQLPQSFIDSVSQVSNEAQRVSNNAARVGQLAIAMKQKYDALNRAGTSTIVKPKEPKSKKPRGISSGTGFFISKMGHVMTNAHVVQNCNKVTIGDNANKQVPAEIINTDRSNDLALLKLSTLEMASVESKSLVQKLGIVVVPLASEGLLRSEDVRLGEKVLVAGYPFGDAFSNTIKVTTGVVSATRGPGDDSGEFQLDAAVQPGNSGGPIYDRSGNIVGIVVARLNKQMFKSENVNFGIKASSVRQFLKSSGFPSKKSDRTEEKSNEQLSEIAKNQALMVMCLQ